MRISGTEPELKIIDKGLQISQASKYIWKVLHVMLWAFSKFGEISIVSRTCIWISQPVFYGDLVYKLRRVKGAANLV